MKRTHLNKLLRQLSIPHQLIANERIELASKMGWSMFDFWHGEDGKIYLEDLIGYDLSGDLQFLTDLNDMRV